MSSSQDLTPTELQELVLAASGASDRHSEAEALNYRSYKIRSAMSAELKEGLEVLNTLLFASGHEMSSAAHPLRSMIRALADPSMHTFTPGGTLTSGAREWQIYYGLQRIVAMTNQDENGTIFGRVCREPEASGLRWSVDFHTDAAPSRAGSVVIQAPGRFGGESRAITPGRELWEEVADDAGAKATFYPANGQPVAVKPQFLV